MTGSYNRFIHCKIHKQWFFKLCIFTKENISKIIENLSFTTPDNNEMLNFVVSQTLMHAKMSIFQIC